MVTIITLGERAGCMTLEAVEALRQAGRVLLRTRQHPAADWLEKEHIAFEALDDLYESAEDFDALNQLLADAVIGQSPCVYAVADAGTDESVRLILMRDPAAVLLPGVTQAGQLIAQARQGYAQAGLAVIPALAIASVRLNAAMPLGVTELDTRLMASEVKLRLLQLYPPDAEVFFRSQRASQTVLLEDLDRQAHYDHTASVWVPAMPLEARTRFTFEDLVDVMDRLRAPDGCPWDREQTHVSLREFLLEEACEAIEAIDQDDMDKLADELGDVLLQVVFHANVDKQCGGFDVVDVTSAICNKMMHRHPHIFGDVVCRTTDDVLTNWEQIKKKEKGLTSQTDAMRDVPRQLPALMRAAKVQKRARDVGFDWKDAKEAFAKIEEETGELKDAMAASSNMEEELGDLLFAVANVGRMLKIQPELALSAATDKFIRRFERLESAILEDGKVMSGMTLEAMDEYWEKIKRKEAGI